MLQSSPFSQRSQIERVRRRIRRPTSLFVLSALAFFAGVCLDQTAAGQGRYQSRQQTCDPCDVFSESQDPVGTGGWSDTAARRNPYVDYRLNNPVSGFDPSSNAGFRPAWNAYGNSLNGQRSIGTTVPAPNFQYPGPAMSAVAGDPPGCPSANSSFTRPGFVSPYSDPYQPAYSSRPPVAANDPGGGFRPFAQTPIAQPNTGDPGGWNSNPSANPQSELLRNRGDCLLYMPWSSMAYLGGTTPSAGSSELFVPLLQNHTNLMYGDVRGFYNNQSAMQGTFGGGYRSLIADSFILGGYGFYDYFNSELHNRFQQATVGIELMTWVWEVRSNGYIPTTNGSGSAGPGAAVIQNGLIYLNGSQQTALSGIDGEFGMLIAADPTARQELRAYAGGYYFYGRNGGTDIPGISSRLEARLYDLNILGQGSRLEMGVISTYDDVNRWQVTGMLNLRIALGQSNCPGNMSLIERRMLDRIVRRYEVQTTNQSSSTELATATINGNATNSVVLVRPGDDLQTIVAAAPNNSLIIVEGGGSSFSAPNGLTLNSGQALVGGGTHLSVVGDSSGRVADLITPGSTPTITDPSGVNKLVTMNSNSSIIGVNLVGGENGIFTNSTNNLLISNVSISQTPCDGLACTNVNGLTITNVTITQTGTAGPLMGGLEVYGASLQNVINSTIDGLTITPANGGALLFSGGTNDILNGLTINAAASNTDAVILQSQTNSIFSNFDINNSAYHGVTITNSTAVTFDQIKLTNIAGDGIEAANSMTFSFAHLNLTNVGGNGLTLNNTPDVAVNNSIFTNVFNVINFLPTENNISGSGNIATGQTTLFTGTTTGGSIQFTTPNATAP